MVARTKNQPTIVSASNLSNTSINQENNTMAREMTAEIVGSAIVSSNNTQAQEAKTMTVTTVAQYAFDNSTVYQNTRTPSISMSAEAIEMANVRNTFFALIQSRKIGFTKAANETRKQGRAVIFKNKYQARQLGRALATFEANVYAMYHRGEQFIQRNAEGVVVGGEFALYDAVGGQHRIVTAYTRDNNVFYDVNYGVIKYNAFGNGELVKGDMHLINASIQITVGQYNKWVDEQNGAVIARAKGESFDEKAAKYMGDWDGAEGQENRNVQYNSIRHINADTVINKYALLMMLLTTPEGAAFEIFHRCKSVESFERFLDGWINEMERAYKSELRKLAGLSFEAGNDGDDK